MKTDDVKHLASLARIRINDDEAEALKDEIADVLEYVSVVNDITADSGVTKKVGARHNVFRKDEVTNEPGSCSPELLAEMPDREGDYLKVKKILNQD